MMAGRSPTGHSRPQYGGREKVWMGEYLLNPEPEPCPMQSTQLLLDHNTLQILDALYYHGSRPVYHNPDGSPVMYSEHAGVLTVHDG